MLALLLLWAIRLEPVARGLTFPIAIVPLEPGVLAVAQQDGLIRIVRQGRLDPAPLLDLRAQTRAEFECGLLGFAVAPDRLTYYVHFTDPACELSTVRRYRFGNNTEGEIVLRQRQPYSNHNGGGLLFGPDGYLYIAFGDGGSGGDPDNFAQNPRSWLGKLLRLDVSQSPYLVPEDNPFRRDPRFKPEIWALGLRNPWRFSFDRLTGDLWIGDVGQDRAEEINYAPRANGGGENYGWRIMEGLECFDPPFGCDRTGLTLPIHEYTRENGDVSVTGGYVYRGAAIPELQGTYLFADYVSGRLWGLRRGEPVRLLLETGHNISTFGEDEAGEIYLASHGEGVVYRLEAGFPTASLAR